MRSNRMTIGFFASFNETAGGVFQYAVSMFRALSQRKEKFIAILAPHSPLSAYIPKHWDIIEYPQHLWTTNEHRQGKISGDGFDLTENGINRGAYNFFKKHNIDLLLFAAPELISFESGIPYIMPFHDLQHRIQPNFPEVSALGTWQWREYLFRNGAKYAHGILVDSETGKEDVLHYYGDKITADKLFILPLPPAYTTVSTKKFNRDNFLKKYTLPEKFFFYPAQFWMHKNHARLFHALHIARFRHGIDMPIALVGSRTGGEAEARERIHYLAMYLAEQFAVQDLTRYLGYVPDEDMPHLYQESCGLIMPTMFGPTNTPVSEAWSLGCPVISSDIRGIREHIGDAGALVNPNSAENIAEVMIQLWTDDAIRQQLITIGKQRISEYNPSHFSVLLNNAIDSVMPTLKEKSDFFL
jgi:glycosyltransferase involved in cell wall biosynthesis